MTKNTEINIFIENAYEDFDAEPLNLAQTTQDAIKMCKFFLSNDGWVKESCLDGYKFDQIYFDVVLVDDEKIKEINRDYREKDKSTDVISFAIFSDSPKEERFIFDGEINLGEILISLDTTSRQAEESSHGKNNFKDELYFLLAHGMLHLLGYDHTTEEELSQMWEIQQEMIRGTI